MTRLLLAFLLVLTMAATAYAQFTLSVPVSAAQAAAVQAIVARHNATCLPQPACRVTAQVYAQAAFQSVLNSYIAGEAERRFLEKSVAEKYRLLTDAEKQQVEDLIDSLSVP